MCLISLFMIKVINLSLELETKSLTICRDETPSLTIPRRDASSILYQCLCIVFERLCLEKNTTQSLKPKVLGSNLDYNLMAIANNGCCNASRWIPRKCKSRISVKFHNPPSSTTTASPTTTTSVLQWENLLWIRLTHLAADSFFVFKVPAFLKEGART